MFVASFAGQGSRGIDIDKARMAHDGEAPATEDYEQAPPRVENKRKFDETGGDDVPVDTTTIKNNSNNNFNGNNFDGGDSGNAVTYNNVPPPLSEFELAKQKAAQIAARLVGAEVKRPRTEEISDDHNGSARNNGLDLSASYGGKLICLSQTRVW